VVTEYIVELLNIHLNPYIDWVPVKFEGLYETTGHKVGLLRFLEIGEDGLELVEHVVFDTFIGISVLVLIELDLEHMPPQICAHEQLLQHRVHVARTAKVAQPDVSRSLLDAQVSIKLTVVNVPPRLVDLAVEFVQELHSMGKVQRIPLAEGQEECESSLSGLPVDLLLGLLMALVCIQDKFSNGRDQIAFLLSSRL
jgi:hypothetical protein